MIKELRTGKPDPKNVAQNFAIWGVSIFALVIILYAEQKSNVFEIFPPEIYVEIIIASIIIAVFCLLSALGVYRRKSWGKRLGQLSAVLLYCAALAWDYLVFLSPENFKTDSFMPFIPAILSVVFLVVAIPVVYYGIRYLGRLPVHEESIIAEPKTFKELSGDSAESPVIGTIELKYHHSFFPYGVAGVAIFILIPFITTLIIPTVILKDLYFIVLFLGIIVFFFLLVISNYVGSPFQSGRRLITTIDGGGGDAVVEASMPFYRLLVYEDGIEIRGFFQCYFIPYDKITGIRKSKLLGSAVEIRSKAPDVPESITFASFHTGKIISMINRYKSITLKQKQNI